jgi:hypothetical protein
MASSLAGGRGLGQRKIQILAIEGTKLEGQF